MSGWIDIGAVDAIPLRGSRTVTIAGADAIAVFRTGDGQVFALRDRCPHKGGPLSKGLVHGHSVACPLHDWRIALATGRAEGGDSGCTPTLEVRIEGTRILLATPHCAAVAA